jgi:4-amino-4-deoxy-L-arabinose transferase-like glycosyltransferase
MLAADRLAAGAVFALAAALRLAVPGRTPLDPFYDAAVRSMSTSWHGFLVGALDPSARVAIDKPPLDLWLQVATTRLFGFGAFALLLPAAVGGTLAVVALYDLLRTLAGPRAALAGALALAVLPVAVISSRSDTMDSVMAALLVGALAVAARGLRDGRVRNLVVAAALVGLAFEVKLFEALVVVVPLALMWWLGAQAPPRRRLAGVALATATGLAVGLAWLVVVTTAVPAAARPWAFGSTDGSPWNAALVYDGWDRLHDAHAPGIAVAPVSRATADGQRPAPPGPLRLLSSRDHLASRLGLELAAAWLALGLVVATRAWRRLDRPQRAGLAALAAWLALGTVLFSAQGALRPRYLEAFDPAIAGCLGVGVALVAGRAGRVAAVGLAAVLAASLLTSVSAVGAHVQDSGTLGALPARRLAHLSAYLRAHQDGARYEVASLAASPAAALIAKDDRPALILSALGHPLVTAGGLSRLVAAGEVRDALTSSGCQTAGCATLARWIRRHGVDVSRAAGLRAGRLYALSR